MRSTPRRGSWTVPPMRKVRSMDISQRLAWALWRCTNWLLVKTLPFHIYKDGTVATWRRLCNCRWHRAIGKVDSCLWWYAGRINIVRNIRNERLRRTNTQNKV